MKMKWITGLVLLASVAAGGTFMFSSLARSLLYYPTHHSEDNGLTPWIWRGEVIGYSRTVAAPDNVWLMLHGNAGQASDRIYAMSGFSAQDSVYILEYPGYGGRKGQPSKETFDQAAKDAYMALREAYPHVPVCVVSESIGSGPAASLAGLSRPPDKFVLIVPFDRLSLVAEDHFPSILVRLFLRDDWDNINALAAYRGPVEIFGAESDDVIPVKHAKALAAAVRGSKLHIIPGGHNDWAFEGRVRIRN